MKKGFTLVEMVISIAISAILLLMVTMVAVFSSHMLLRKDEQGYIEEIILLDQYFQKLFDQAQHIEFNEDTLKVDDYIITLIEYTLMTQHIEGISIILSTTYVSEIVFSHDATKMTLRMYVHTELSIKIYYLQYHSFLLIS